MSVRAQDLKAAEAGLERAAACRITIVKNSAPDESIAEDDLMDIVAMQDINSDVIGYLKVQGQGFPVVSSENPEKYLKTGWDNVRTACGSIFKDPASSDKNMVLYGHHMKNGSMFGSLQQYLDETYRAEHETFTWITADYVDSYSVKAVIRTKADFSGGVLDMDTKQDFDELGKQASETGVLYEPLHTGKTYMTLVTCEYTRKNGRLLVIGERTEHAKRPDAKEE